MATPGAAHEAMVEAFTRRISEVIPEARITLGKKDRKTHLKPDVLIEVGNDQNWAFEMVHGNQNPNKIRANHEKYVKAGIKDTWILWDSLRPKAGKRRSVAQGVFAYKGQDQPVFKLTLPHKAILSLQNSAIRFIFSFTCDPAGVGADVITSDLLRAIMIGVNIYKFSGWNGEDQYPAQTAYVPISELRMDSESNFIFPDEEISPTSDFILCELGFNQDYMIVLSSVEKLQGLLSTPEGLKQITDLGLLHQIMNLSPEEVVEIQDFFNSEAMKNIKPFEGKISQDETYQVFQDSEKMALLANDTNFFLEYVKTAPIPNGLKKMILNLFGDGKELISLSNFMTLQANSSNFQKLYQKKPGDF